MAYVTALIDCAGCGAVFELEVPENDQLDLFVPDLCEGCQDARAEEESNRRLGTWNPFDYD